MKIVKLRGNLDIALEASLLMLSRGEVLVCPTDTVYGLIADSASPNAIAKIVQIKQRAKSKPLGVFVKNLAMAKKFAQIQKRQEKTLRRAWPGKTTFILKSKGSLPKGLGARGTIGMRAPRHRLLQEILKAWNYPLVQTSANVSGKPALTTSTDILNTFLKRKYHPELIIDGGTLSGTPSKVIDLTGPKPKIIRKT